MPLRFPRFGNSDFWLFAKSLRISRQIGRLLPTQNRFPVTRDARPSAQSATTRGADPNGILASIGLVPYDWRIDTDTLTWGANAAEVLQVRDVTRIGTGRSYAAFLDPKNTSTRYDAVMDATGRDYGAGVPYQTEYCLLTGPDGGVPLWVEDNGRWFAGPDGRPARAHGVVRAVTERHQNEQQLTYLSRFDSLTGEMNRNALTETLTATLEEALKYRGSCGFMMIAVDNLARINEVLRVRRRRRGDRGGGAAPAQPHAGGRHAGPLFIQQVRRGAQELHARRPHDGGRPVSDGGARRRGADRERPGRCHHHDRRRGGAASCAHGRRDPRAHAGIARHRQGQAARHVRCLPAERRARGAASGKRPLNRQDHHGAQRAAHSDRVRARGDDVRPPGGLP